MTTPDPRWLELLKATAWQTFAVACASGVFLMGSRQGWLPKTSELLLSIAAFAFLLCSALTIASVVSGVLQFFGVRQRFIRWMRRRREERELATYIPHMTHEERAIIAYLLARDQKTIIADQDGGHAMTLISRGVLVRALRPGQVFNLLECPFAVPDHLWDVLVEQRDAFPHQVDPEQPYPWRKHWMAR